MDTRHQVASNSLTPHQVSSVSSVSSVEVPGIEPGSNGVSLGILRAQPRCRGLGLRASCGTARNTAQQLLVVPSHPVTGQVGQSPQRRQSRGGDAPGLTDLEARSGGEGEISALGIGTCVFGGSLSR